MDNPLLHFIQAAFADKTNSKMVFEFHVLSEKQVAALLQKTGHDLTGYRRVLDSFSLIYAEEIRAKRKELATLTLYKQKIRKR